MGTQIPSVLWFCHSPEAPEASACGQTLEGEHRGGSVDATGPHLEFHSNSIGCFWFKPCSSHPAWVSPAGPSPGLRFLLSFPVSAPPHSPPSAHMLSLLLPQVSPPEILLSLPTHLAWITVLEDHVCTLRIPPLKTVYSSGVSVLGQARN